MAKFEPITVIKRNLRLPKNLHYTKDLHGIVVKVQHGGEPNERFTFIYNPPFQIQVRVLFSLIT